MSRLIDADVLRRELIKGHDLIGAKYVDLAPDIDAVEVVRCKDCIAKDSCNLFGFDDMDFCSGGKRKDETDY